MNNFEQPDAFFIIETDLIGVKSRLPSSDSHLDLGGTGGGCKSRGRATIIRFDEQLVLPDWHRRTSGPCHSRAKGRPLANRGRRLAVFGSWQLQHRRMLTCVYSSERHNCAVGKFESVVMDPGRLDVDFPEPREGASRPLRPRHPFARIPRRCGKREFSTGPQANSDAGCMHICEAPRQSIGKLVVTSRSATTASLDCTCSRL